MSQVIVITFEDAEQAGKVRQSLRKLEADGQLQLDDAVVLVKDADGKLHAKDEMDRSVKIGAVGGSLLGVLIGGILFPFAGLLLGAAGGALLGKAVSGGIDKKFIKEVKEGMQPGSSAIFVVVREAYGEVAVATMRQYHGQIYHTSLDAETEEALRQALK